jgi:hypothetical protein
MKKLKLNLEDVKLESFEMIASKESASGTVHGREREGDWSWDWTVCLSGCNGTYYPGHCDDSGDWSYCTCMTAADSACTAT